MLCSVKFKNCFSVSLMQRKHESVWIWNSWNDSRFRDMREILEWSGKFFESSHVKEKSKDVICLQLFDQPFLVKMWQKWALLHVC